MIAVRGLIGCALLLATADTGAIAPESGMYWQPDRSGRAIYVEHQKGRVGLAIYAFHRETGEAEIYVTGGFLEPVADDPEAHRFEADLWSASHGPPLTFPDNTGVPATTEKVGRIVLTFARAGSIGYSISLDDGGSDTGEVERFSFGHARYGLAGGQRLAFDLRGEWVFVDQANPQQAAKRFRFMEREPADPQRLYTINERFEITYLDPSRDARLVCAAFFGNTGSPPAPLKRPGCELYIGDELQLSANLDDVGLDRIQAYRGPLPLIGEGPLRGTEAVIGLRLVLPPESD